MQAQYHGAVKRGIDCKIAKYQFLASCVILCDYALIQTTLLFPYASLVLPSPSAKQVLDYPLIMPLWASSPIKRRSGRHPGIAGLK